MRVTGFCRSHQHPAASSFPGATGPHILGNIVVEYPSGLRGDTSQGIASSGTLEGVSQASSRRKTSSKFPGCSTTGTSLPLACPLQQGLDLSWGHGVCLGCCVLDAGTVAAPYITLLRDLFASLGAEIEHLRNFLLSEIQTSLERMERTVAEVAVVLCWRNLWENLPSGT